MTRLHVFGASSAADQGAGGHARVVAYRTEHTCKVEWTVQLCSLTVTNDHNTLHRRCRSALIVITDLWQWRRVYTA